MNLNRVRVASLVVGLLGFWAEASFAVEVPEKKIKEHVETSLRGIAQATLVLDAIHRQNTKHAHISEAEIRSLDQQWTGETKTAKKPLKDSVLTNRTSAYLMKVKNESHGLYTEIFVMDSKGLNVGQSDITSDYWQGDEAKWQQTFSVGPKAIYIDKPKFDESTQKFQIQVSFSITDVTGKNVIGAITVGMDAESLRMRE